MGMAHSGETENDGKQIFPFKSSYPLKTPEDNSDF